jgi:hypothetical protein
MVKIYNDESAFSRAFAAGRVQVASDNGRALSRILSSRNIALREDDATYSQATTFPSLPADSSEYSLLFLTADPVTGDLLEVWQGPDGRQYQNALLAAIELNKEVVVEGRRQALLPQLLTGPRVLQDLDIAHYRDDRVDIEADLDRVSMVVLTDAYYPGWSAYVDGQPRDIYRVNSIVRGVMVESGSHEVSFRYEPAFLRAWIALSIGSSLLSLLLACWKKRERAHQFSPSV